MRKLIIAALLLSAPMLAACNTVEGFGKDLKKAGGKVENAAQKTGGTD